MKISSSRFLKEVGRKTHHKKPFKDDRRTLALLSLLMIAVISLTNSITTPLSLFNQEEARASQEEQQQEGTSGLKVYVDLYHNRRGSAQLCVYSTYQNLGCNTINLSQYASSPVRSGPWTFSPEMVEVGETFRVCVSNLNTGGQSRCISGTNGPEKEPEYISLTVPGAQQPSPPPPQQQLPGFLRIGINWRQVCNDYDIYIIEPCGTLVTRDGYGLTAEGVRVLACFAGGALVLIYPQLAAYSYLCGQGGGN